MKTLRKIAGVIVEICIWALIPALIISCFSKQWWILISTFMLFLISFEFLFITATDEEQSDTLKYMNENW